MVGAGGVLRGVAFIGLLIALAMAQSTSSPNYVSTYRSTPPGLPTQMCPQWTLNGTQQEDLDAVRETKLLTLTTEEPAEEDDPPQNWFYTQDVDSPIVYPIVVEFTMRFGSGTITGVADVSPAMVGVTIDAAGRGIFLLIRAGSIALTSATPGVVTSASVDTTLVQHTYRIEVNAAGEVDVFYDAGTSPTLEGTLYDGAFADAETVQAARVLWGDATDRAFGVTDWTVFRHTATACAPWPVTDCRDTCKETFQSNLASVSAGGSFVDCPQERRAQFVACYDRWNDESSGKYARCLGERTECSEDFDGGRDGCQGVAQDKPGQCRLVHECVSCCAQQRNDGQAACRRELLRAKIDGVVVDPVERDACRAVVQQVKVWRRDSRSCRRDCQRSYRCELRAWGDCVDRSAADACYGQCTNKCDDDALARELCLAACRNAKCVDLERNCTLVGTGQSATAYENACGACEDKTGLVMCREGAECEQATTTSTTTSSSTSSTSRSTTTTSSSTSSTIGF